MKRTTRLTLLSSITAAVLVSAVAWSLHRRSRTVYTDGATIREPLGQATVRPILWQPPIELSASINSSGDEYEPWISPDGEVLLFVRGKAGENADIYCSKRLDRSWSDPQPIASINTDADELGPQIAPDGAFLYFYSNRKGGSGGYDLWRAPRAGDEWGTAENLGPQINSSWNEYGIAISIDGAKIYFGSNRPRSGETAFELHEAWPATLRENINRRDYDLYCANIGADRFATPVAVTDLNTAANEGMPSLSPAGDFLYFCSDRAGGQGGFDLYRSRLLRDALQAPENLGWIINSPDHDMDPSLSMSGFALHFSSDRQIHAPDQQDRKDYNLYYSESREVFKESEPRSASIDWLSLVSAVWPKLLWALLALLLLLLLWKLWRTGRLHTLGLLARCLILSVIAHLLLMMLFMIWGVTVGLADAIHRGQSTRVSLSSGGQDQGLVAQIRGELSDVQFESAQTPLARLAEVPVEEPPPVAAHARPDDSREPLIVQDTALAQAPIAADAPAPLHHIPPMFTLTAMEQPQPFNPRLPNGSPAAFANESKLAALQTSMRAERVDQTAPLDRAQSHVMETAPTGAAMNRIAVDPSAMQSLAIPAPATDAAPKAPSEATNLPSIGMINPPEMPAQAVALPRADQPAAASSSEAQPVPTPARQSIATGRVATNPVVAPALSPAHLGTPPPIDATPAKSIESLAKAESSAIADAPPAQASRAAAAPLPMIQLEDAQAALPQELRTPLESGPAQPTAVEAEIAIDVAGSSASAGAVRATKVDSLIQPSAGERFVSQSANMPASPLPLGDQQSLAAPLSDAAASTSHAPSPRLAAVDSSAASIPLLPPLAPELQVPAETAPPVDVYKQRAAPNRLEIVKQMGGSEATERAVGLALKWLAAHQSPDGRWDADHFDDQCKRCGGPAKFDADLATTGLALLCFLGADHTHLKDGPYRSPVQRGLEWLKSQQKPTGDLRGNESMYSHGIASIALSEAYGMTRDQALVDPVRRAIDFIIQARDSSGRHGVPANAGGWRYEPGQPGDTSVLGWQVMALVSADRAGIHVPADALEASRNWLDEVCPANNRGLYAYQPGERFTPAMTAEGMFSQQLLGRAHDEPRMQASAEYLAGNLPNWRIEPNTYYWYYATLALFQHQGDAWEKWNAAIIEQLVSNQNDAGTKAGSWDPIDRWSKIGGRIYQTAMCTLSLEVYYRYLPLYQSKQRGE